MGVDLGQLRRVAAIAGDTPRAALIAAAADEIERLRAELAALRRQVATGQAVYVPLGPQCTCYMPGRVGFCPVHREAGA